MELNNKYIRIVAIIIPIILAIICIDQVIKNNNQASMPIPKEYTFSGEYSFDGKKWYTYDEDSEMSALEGDVIVKGHLDSDILEGGMLNIYCNHIGVSVYVNGELVYIDTPTEIRNYGIDLMPSMCGKRWEQTLCPAIAAQDEIEFRFINYHKHGNENAYKEALSSLLITPPDNTILEIYLESYIKPVEMVGYALLIVAVMLLGASLAAVIFKSSMVKRLFHIGIATLCVGGYVVFDVMMAYFMDELLVVKTYGSQLCLMLAVYFIGMMVCDALKNDYKKVANIAIISAGVVDAVIIVLVLKGELLLYDTLYYWEFAQYIISGVLILLCILELKKEKKFNIELISYVCVYIAILIDMASVSYNMYYYGMSFKSVYVIMLVVFFVCGVKSVI